MSRTSSATAEALCNIGPESWVKRSTSALSRLYVSRKCHAPTTSPTASNNTANAIIALASVPSRSKKPGAPGIVMVTIVSGSVRPTLCAAEATPGCAAAANGISANTHIARITAVERAIPAARVADARRNGSCSGSYMGRRGCKGKATRSAAVETPAAAH